MTKNSTFSTGDPVWSKMKGYCPWPSRIADLTESSLENKATDKVKAQKDFYLVYFFGSNNFAWMPEDTIKPYEEFKDKNKKGSRTQQFKLGIEEIEAYVAAGGREAFLENLSSVAITHAKPDSPSKPNDDISLDADDSDGGLPSIDDEIAIMNTTKNSAASSKKLKNSNDSQNDSSLTSPTPSSVQKDYSRTPFKSRKSAAKGDDISSDITSPTKRMKTSESEGFGISSLSTNSTSASSANLTSKSTASKISARSTIMRVTTYDMPVTETPQINLTSISAKSRSVRPSNLKIGFIGLGFIGQRLLKNLLNSGHNVTIFNRTKTKYKGFVEAGAKGVDTPLDVINETDITFVSLANPTASKDIVFGPFGLLSGDLSSGKGIVEMSSLDPETSIDISEAIIAKGGRFLEAPTVLSGKQTAEDGELTIIAAGDKSLYEDAMPCFQAMGKKTFFLSHQPSLANRMNLIVSMLYGSILSALTECNHMIEGCKELQLSDFKDILQISTMHCPLIINTLNRLIAIKSKSNPGEITVPIGQIQKDLKHALEVADTCDQSIPMTAIANELFKTAKMAGFSEHDTTSLVKARF